MNASGSITSLPTACPFPFNLVVRNGSGLSLGDNPDDCHLIGGAPPCLFGPDGGAILEV